MERSKQHWVPSSYLDPWCDPERPEGHEPFVWIFPKSGGAGRRKAPDNIFKETDFYTLHTPDGQRDLSLENGLGTLESQFCRIRDAHILRREALSPEDKAWICAFVAAMHFRTRGQRDAFQAQWSHALRVAEDLQQALNRMSPEELMRHRPIRSLPGDESGPSLTIEDVRTLSKEPLQHMLFKIIENDFPVLQKMTLTFFTTGDPIGFITSDHPCLWFDPDKPRGRPTSLESPSVEVTMPVSPDTLLVLCWEEFPDYLPIPPPHVDEGNRMQQGACDEYLVVCRNVTKPVWFT